jgi:YD repeat-containing protein
MGVVSRRRLTGVLLPLLATSALTPQHAAATTQPYVWDGCQIEGGSGCSSGYADNPEDACNSDLGYYGGATLVSLAPGVDTTGGVINPDWVCTWSWMGSDFDSEIYPDCPTGDGSDSNFSTNACAAPPEPKDQGDNPTAADSQSPTDPLAPDDPDLPDSPCGAVGDPITVASGNKFQQAVDYRSVGLNVIDFVRSYNSQSQLAGSLGVSWERRLLLSGGTPSTHVTAIRADGQQLTFTYGGSAYTSDTDVTLALAYSGGNYTLTDTADTVETYNSAGQLQSVAFADGYTQTLNYTSGQLTSVSDNQSRALTFTYNADGTLATLTDPDSNVYIYKYTSAFLGSGYSGVTTKKLASVTDPLTHTVTYAYENSTFPTYLTGIIDELGNRFATWTYDSLGEATASTLADSADTTMITYNSDGTKTVSFPLGEMVTYTFATVANAPKISTEKRVAAGSIPAATATFTYDGNGFLASKTDWDVTAV